MHSDRLYYIILKGVWAWADLNLVWKVSRRQQKKFFETGFSTLTPASFITVTTFIN